MNASVSKAPADKLRLYEKLVAVHPKAVRKGKTIPYTSINGHMYSFLTPEGTLALRVPKGTREEFLQTHNCQLCEQYGRVMKEYVEVPDKLLRDAEKIGT